MTAGPLDAVTKLPGVFEAAEAARSSVDALLRDLRTPALRSLVPRVAAAALARSALASAALEPDAVRAEAGAVRVATELPALGSVWRRAPVQALARLHTLAAVGETSAAELGRPRRDPAVGPRLAGLVEMVAGAQAPAVVVAAVVHGELLAIAPFASRNGLVARAAWRLVLLDRGLDPHLAVVPEEGIVALGPQAYADALESYRSGRDDGVADWVVHCATAVALGGRAGRTVADEVLAAS